MVFELLTSRTLVLYDNTTCGSEVSHSSPHSNFSSIFFLSLIISPWNRNKFSSHIPLLWRCVNTRITGVSGQIFHIIWNLRSMKLTQLKQLSLLIEIICLLYTLVKCMSQCSNSTVIIIIIYNQLL